MEGEMLVGCWKYGGRCRHRQTPRGNGRRKTNSPGKNTIRQRQHRVVVLEGSGIRTHLLVPGVLADIGYHFKRNIIHVPVVPS